jgi:hypothetical protein
LQSPAFTWQTVSHPAKKAGYKMRWFDNLRAPNTEPVAFPGVKKLRAKIADLKKQIDDSKKKIAKLAKQYGVSQKVRLSTQWLTMLSRLDTVDENRVLDLYGKVSVLLYKQEELFDNWTTMPNAGNELEQIRAEYQILYQQAKLFEQVHQQSTLAAGYIKINPKPPLTITIGKKPYDGFSGAGETYLAVLIDAKRDDRPVHFHELSKAGYNNVLKILGAKNLGKLIIRTSPFRSFHRNVTIIGQRKKKGHAKE